MDPNFWQQKWAEKDIGFHQSQVHPLLAAHLQQLNRARGARIFLPLCGKTLDIHWLLSQGFKVVGAELSAIAVAELFEELGITPVVTELGDVAHYKAPNLDIYRGDIFALTRELLGPVDVIYDRAALVALPPVMRKDYAQHLIQITKAAQQLLITFDYEQSLMDGPPFSVPASELKVLYGNRYNLQILAQRQLLDSFRSKISASEIAWLLVN